MFDGIKLMAEIPDFQDWKKTAPVQLSTPVDLQSGSIKEWRKSYDNFDVLNTMYFGNFESYKISVKEVKRIFADEESTSSYYLTFKGSLHKNYFIEQNYSRFTWVELQREINKVSEVLALKEADVKITHLELGVNVEVPFKVSPFLQHNLIACKNKPFNSYDPQHGYSLGLYCPFTQYRVKVYDKGNQYHLPDNLLRLEIHYMKMQLLKGYGIKKFSDLRDKERVYKLKHLLLKSWDDILVYDSSINLQNDQLKPKDRGILLNGRNPKYWEQLKGVERNNKKKAYNKLVAAHGQNVHAVVRKLIEDEWDRLFNIYT